MDSIKKINFDSWIFFLLSPFLTVFVHIFHIAKGSRVALNFFVVVMGLVGYIYVPTWTNDKTRYYERYEEFQNFNFQTFIDYLIVSKRPDFVYESLIYLFSFLGLNIQFLFLAVNTFCVYTIFKITDLITHYFISNKRFLCFLLIFFSFALQHLYSGIRFTFATCLFLWAIYLIDYEGKKGSGILLLVVTCLTHFSLLAFVVPFVIYRIGFKFNYKYIFIISLLFLVVPKEILAQYFSSLEVNEGYGNKVDAYVNGDDFATQNFANNVSSIIVYYIRNCWIYVAYIFLLYIKPPDKRLTQLLFLFLSFLNVFYAFPTIFSRYLIVCKFVFTIYLIYNYLEGKIDKVFKLFLFLFFLSFIVDVYVMRENWAETFTLESVLNIYTILSREVNLDSVIDNKP